MYMDFLAMYLVGILKKKNYIHELILEPINNNIVYTVYQVIVRHIGG